MLEKPVSVVLESYIVYMVHSGLGVRTEMYHIRSVANIHDFSADFVCRSDLAVIPLYERGGRQFFIYP